jgi:hypothetical protein
VCKCCGTAFGCGYNPHSKSSFNDINALQFLTCYSFLKILAARYCDDKKENKYVTGEEWALIVADNRSQQWS